MFCTDGDISEIRKFNTPPPVVMERKINSFTEKGQVACDRDGEQLFKTETNTAITNVMKHINNRLPFKYTTRRWYKSQ